MVDQDGESLRPLTLAPANGLAERAPSVRHEELQNQHNLPTRAKGRTYNVIILDAVRLAPCRHDEGIIGGNEDDLVNARGLELVHVGEVRGEVLFSCLAE